MSHSRSLVAILVAMQWANEDVFNSGSGGDMYCMWRRNQAQYEAGYEKREGEGVELKMIDGSFRCHV